MRLRGGGSWEDCEVLLAALIPRTRPSPAVDPENPGDPTCDAEKDPRDHGARMFDALV